MRKKLKKMKGQKSKGRRFIRKVVRNTSRRIQFLKRKCVLSFQNVLSLVGILKPEKCLAIHFYQMKFKTIPKP